MHLSKRFFFSFLVLLFTQLTVLAQQSGNAVIFTGGTIHVGNGTVIENGMLAIQAGKIVYVGSMGSSAFKNGTIIDVKGKHLYPGLIALCNYAGLNEIDAAKPTRDFAETGDLNPNVRSLIAYNCDSRILPTLLCNGVTYVQSTPMGGVISGSSSLMKTVCNNWEDGAVAKDMALHINWPEFVPQSWWNEAHTTEIRKRSDENLQKLKAFFTEAKKYTETNQHGEAKFDAVKGVFSGKQKVFVSAQLGSSVIDAGLFFKSLGITIVWAGGKNALSIAPFLKENNIPVVLQTIHTLPAAAQTKVDDPFTLAAALKKLGITCCISNHGSWEVRNLPFNAGTACAYGLSKEEALMAITLVPAQILGVDSTIGSLQEGKAGTVIITSGDILNMTESKTEHVYVNGIEVSLADNPQYQLYQKFNSRYFGE